MKVKHATDKRTALRPIELKQSRICRECKRLREYGHDEPRSVNSWIEVVWVAMHNIWFTQGGRRDFFHYKDDICDYIDKHWNSLCLNKNKTTTWSKTVSSTITTNRSIFKHGPTKGYWGLIKQHISLSGERYNEQNVQSSKTQQKDPLYEMNQDIISKQETIQENCHEAITEERILLGNRKKKRRFSFLRNFEEKSRENNSEKNTGKSTGRVRLIIRRSSPNAKVTLIVEEDVNSESTISSTNESFQSKPKRKSKPKKRRTETENLLDYDSPKNNSLNFIPNIDVTLVLPVFWDEGNITAVQEIVKRRPTENIQTPNFREISGGEDIQEILLQEDFNESEEDISDSFYEELHSPLEYLEHQQYLKITTIQNQIQS